MQALGTRLTMADVDRQCFDKDYLYQLIGCDELSTEDQINTEYKIRAKNLHPDKNSGKEESTEEFIRLNKAKEVLCDKEQRKKYDFWRRSCLAIPFDLWLKTDNSNHMSVHWAPKPKKAKMIEGDHEGSGVRQGNSVLETSRKRSRNDVKKGWNTAKSQKTLEPVTWERKSSWGDSNLNQFRNYTI